MTCKRSILIGLNSSRRIHSAVASSIPASWFMEDASPTASPGPRRISTISDPSGFGPGLARRWGEPLAWQTESLTTALSLFPRGFWVGGNGWVAGDGVALKRRQLCVNCLFIGLLSQPRPLARYVYRSGLNMWNGNCLEEEDMHNSDEICIPGR